MTRNQPAFSLKTGNGEISIGSGFLRNEDPEKDEAFLSFGALEQVAKVGDSVLDEAEFVVLRISFSSMASVEVLEKVVTSVKQLLRELECST